MISTNLETLRMDANPTGWFLAQQIEANVT